jgi:LemA protein
MTFNTRVQSFPVNILAGMFGFSNEAFFEIEDEAAREVPEVKF